MSVRPILVTGVAGFIGSHLAQALLARGEHVAGVDNFDAFYPKATKLANLEAVRAGGGAFEFAEGDITDAGAMRLLFERVRPRGVIHLAAKAGVRPSLADPVGYAHANITGTAVILVEAARAGCERVVAASSSSVYGNSPTAPFSESQDVNSPISPYAATKRACELIGSTHHHLTGMPTAMLRFFTVYGPRQRPDLAINLFLTRVSRGEPIRMFGDGSMSRDFTFVSDIVAGVIAAYDRIPAHGYRVWNLGNNNPVSLSDMIAGVERVVGRKAVLQKEPMQPGDVLRTWADLTRSTTELGYSPSTPFDRGIELHWAWLKARIA